MFRCVILETRPREACHLTLTSSCCCIIYSSATRLLFQSFRTSIQKTKNQRRSLMDGTAGFVRTRKRLYVYTPFGFFLSQAVPNLLSKCNIYRERVAKINPTLKSNRSVSIYSIEIRYDCLVSLKVTIDTMSHFGGWLWGWFGVMSECSMGGRQLWRSFLRNLVTANKKSDSFPNTVPQCNSTQRRPWLARNLKMADIIRTLEPMTSLTPAGWRSIHLARERLAESKAIH